MSKTESIFDVEINTLVYGGDAMGRLPDGRAVFVPFALPGERVRLRLVKAKRSYAHAELVEILSTSDERIEPRCCHFSDCGGCHYQHLAYQRQVEIKTEILREQLVRIAGVDDPPIQEMVPSLKAWNYRNAVQFHLTSDGKIGYKAVRSNHVVAISECHLPEKYLNEIWPQMEIEPVPGLERVGLRQGIEGNILLILESSTDKPIEFAVDIPVSAVHMSPMGAIVLAGDDNVIIKVLGRQFLVSAGSFFQVNTLQAEALVKYLLQVLPLSSETTVMDIYCGVGLFSAFLAPRVKRCVSIEVSDSACEDFTVNLDEFDNVELYKGAAGNVLVKLDLQPDVVVVDPPRSGLERSTLDALVSMQPPFLAYVSCDPATLGRDTRRLIKKGYQLISVKPIDMFPQTYHIESVTIFNRV